MRRFITKGFVLFFFILAGCGPFLEKSLLNSKVILDSPANGLVLTDYSETFHWEPVDNALSYELQIVTPGFDTIKNFLLDTVLRKTQFTFSIHPGIYQWRVKAINGSSETAFTRAYFRVDTSSISSQTVILSSPVSGTVFNQQSLVLSWQTLFGSSLYQIQIDTAGFAASQPPAYSFTVSQPTYTFSLPREGTYSWRVKGMNGALSSQFSAPASFTYDKTPPNPPVLTAPANGLRMTPPDTLTWQAVGDAASYKVYLYKADSLTLYNTSFPALVNSTSFVFSAGLQGEKIYWSVTAIDRAGNESKLPFKKYFTVGP